MEQKTIDILKDITAIVIIIGAIVSFFNVKLKPHVWLRESSPKRPKWLPWLSWILTSIPAILYIILDYLG